MNDGAIRERFRARAEDGHVALAAVDPANTSGLKRKAADAELIDNAETLGELQGRLHAEGKRSLLIILQSLDTGGKDGTIKHAMSGLNAQGVRVVNFKIPTKEEASHHFLWRMRRALPGPGEIVIFNRSHYEDVLVPRVKRTLPESVINRRYREINAFEAELNKAGTTVVKLCLHISYDEQRDRLLRRLHDPTKQWKFSENDIHERGYWDDYMAAFDAAISATATSPAPWYIIPANHKWYRNWAVSHILIETIAAMKPRYPRPRLDVRKMVAMLEPEPVVPLVKPRKTKKREVKAAKETRQEKKRAAGRATGKAADSKAATTIERGARSPIATPRARASRAKG